RAGAADPAEVEIVGVPGRHDADRSLRVTQRQAEVPCDVVACTSWNHAERDAGPGDQLQAEADHAVAADHNDAVRIIVEKRTGGLRSLFSTLLYDQPDVMSRGFKRGSRTLAVLAAPPLA